MTVSVPFIVCYPRSGSTLLRLMLDSHPEMAIPPETHFCRLFGSEVTTGPLSEQKRVAIFRQIVSSPRWGDFRLDAEEFRQRLGDVPNGVGARRALAAFWEFYAEKQGKSRWGDKTPGHILCTAKIAATFPEARFIHIVRDGRDVAASMRGVWFARGRTVADLADDWVSRISGFRKEVVRLGLPAHTVHYEDLVTSPAATLKAACDVIDLAYTPTMLDYRQRADARLLELSDLRSGDRLVLSSERIASHMMVHQPPKTDRIGRWRELLSADELATFEAIAGQTLWELGYSHD